MTTTAAVPMQSTTERGWHRELPMWAMGVPFALAASFCGIVVADTRGQFAQFISLAFAALCLGGMVGFLVGGPGSGPGDSGRDAANQAGWGQRLGVFGNWITGAAFALVIANAGAIADWFAALTALAADQGGQIDQTYRLTLGAWALASAGVGFVIGFFQMATEGPGLLNRRANAGVAAAPQGAATGAGAGVTASSAPLVHAGGLPSDDELAIAMMTISRSSGPGTGG